MPAQAERIATADERGFQTQSVDGFLFEAPLSEAGTPSTARACKYAPAFISAIRDPVGADAITSEIGGARSRPTTFLRSRGNEIISILAKENAALWRPSEPPFAACLAQCVLLPEYARTVRITLTKADGRSRCAQLPSVDIPFFEAALIDCDDGSRWADVVTHPVQGDWLVCATVVNTTSRPTNHRMSVLYEYRHVQIGANGH